MIKPILEKESPVLNLPTVPCVPVMAVGGFFSQVISQRGIHEHWLPLVIQAANDLVDTAESMADNCLGLSANQIWDNNAVPCPSVFVMRWPTENQRGWDWQILINPIVKGSGPTLKLKESCLSIPNYVKIKSRAKNATVTFQTLENHQKQTYKFLGTHGNYAHILQHEFDHLNGKLLKK